MKGCGQCADCWMCETHPGKPQNHDSCGGAGMPCENPACDYSIKKTGLVCPSCRNAMGKIETQTARVIAFKCDYCTYQWFTETRPGKRPTRTH